MTTDIRYRPDVDGLRAVAVGLVLAFHAFPGRVPGGYTGVDVFFVISGYLISSIIVEQARAGRFTIGRFYAARARRIFPALAVVLLATLAAGAALLVADDYATLGAHALAGAGFVSNLLLWSESGYFDQTSALKPLLHLWSLGIEEQFYLAWPLVLLVALRRGWRLDRLALAVALVSFAACVWLARTDAVAAFYNPLTRAWELMLGALLAFAGRRADGSPLSLGNAAAFAGAALILMTALAINEATPFPGWWGLPPTLGAVLLIAAGPGAWLNRHVLGSRPFVQIGLISYPLYLWHWPVLAFLLIANDEQPLSTPVRAAAVALSVALAWATYRLLERPIRLRPLAVAPRVAGAMAAVAAVAAGVLVTGGAPGRPVDSDPRLRFVAAYARFHREGLREAYRLECDFYDQRSGGRRAALDPSCTRPGAAGTVFLWGDSHAQALSHGLGRALPPGWALAQVATSGCRPALGPTDRQTPANACNRSNAFALDAVARLRPAVVVLAQEAEHEATDWTAIARRLRAAGVRRVVLAGPLPAWRPSLPRVVANHHWAATPPVIATGLDPAPARTDAWLSARYAASPALSYVSLMRELCDARGCLALVPGAGPRALTAVDYGHLSPAASRLVAARTLAPALALPPAG